MTGGHSTQGVILPSDTGTVTILKPMRALVVENITGDLPSGPLPAVRGQPYLQGLQLADPSFDKPGRVDMLLGVDSLPFIMGNSISYSDDRLLWATETAYGWVISGTCQSQQSTTRSHLCLAATTIDQQTQDLLISFLEAESLSSTDTTEPTLTQEEQRAEDHFIRTHSRQPDGRYVVQLSRKADLPELGCSRDQALRRHRQNTLSLQRKGKLEEFQDALWDYARRHHAERVPPEELLLPENESYYLPNHGVFKESSTTTKLRVVFDASATTTSGHSLNDQLLAGPNLYPQLVPILLNFRRHVVGMTSDIGKMFREIALDPCETNFHRFLMTTPEGAVEDWRMVRLTFGVTSSPFLATRVLRHAATLYQDELPDAANIILQSIYVDDCIMGADSEQEAVRIRKQLNELLSRTCMVLRKWRSNSQALLDTIPEELKETETIQLFSSPEEHHKALGVHWDTHSDCLHAATPPPSPILHPTKRQVASEIARVFDLMGWFAPAVIQLKIMLQRLWKLGLTWDIPVPDDIASAWRDWQSEQPCLSEFPVSRCCFDHNKKIFQQHIHGFSDASNVAFGGVVYLRTTYTDTTVSISLLLAKTKVAKLSSPNTTQRLELCAALLLSQLIRTVAVVLDVSPDSVFAWSDSTITLNWINVPPGSHNPYVSNRVTKIVERVPASRWRHVPTDSNPADLASRGLSPQLLVENSLWWYGPAWLQLEPGEWPSYNGWRRSRAENPELVCYTALEELPTDELVQRFSGYRRMLRVLSWCRRFIKNVRFIKEARCFYPVVSLDELQATEELLLQQSQQRSFPLDITHLKQGQELPKKSSLLQRNPFLDPKGLLRVGGRLQQLDITEAQKHPVILHRRDVLTKQICWQKHRDSMHVGPSGLITLLSLEYHIIGTKQLVRDVSKACVRCQRHYARTTSQLMGQLPPCRATPAPAFTATGMDFAGPFSLKKGHTRKPTWVNGYVCLFVCLTTRAVHLEIVMDLTTEALMAAFGRFVARRGRPNTILSDNGTNFVGAHRVIDAAYHHLDLQDSDGSLLQFLADQRITWKHSPARSPHFGGIWEAGVRQMKSLLYKHLGPRKLTTEQMYTVLTEVEAILNSRPLMPMESSPTDGAQILTPAHFLIGRSLKSLPSDQATGGNIEILRHWNLCQRLVQDIWKEWSGTYLQLLQRQHKWLHPKRSLLVGDIVLLKDPELFLKSWPLAIVEQVHPGADGLVRVATVRTSKGIYKRAVTAIVPLVTCRPPEDVQD